MEVYVQNRKLPAAFRWRTRDSRKRQHDMTVTAATGRRGEIVPRC
jgi:hypothetical protein